MAFFSIALLGLLFTIILLSIGIFVVLILPFITSFIAIPSKSDKRIKKVFKMWGGVLVVQLLTSLIMIVIALLIDSAVPFETWSESGTGFLGFVNASVFKITPILLLMCLTLFWYKRINIEKTSIGMYIIFGIQSVIMSFVSGVPIIIVFAVMQN